MFSDYMFSQAYYAKSLPRNLSSLSICLGQLGHWDPQVHRHLRGRPCHRTHYACHAHGIHELYRSFAGPVPFALWIFDPYKGFTGAALAEQNLTEPNMSKHPLQRARQLLALLASTTGVLMAVCVGHWLTTINGCM